MQQTQNSAAATQGARPVRDWTQGSISRNLLSLSWPMIVSNSLNVLGPTVDMIWVGRLGDNDIAAVGIAGTIVMLVNALTIGVFTGLRSMVARNIGAKDETAANHVAQQAFVLAIIYSVVLAGAGIFFSEQMLSLLGAQPDVVALGAPYLRIQFIGMAAMTFRTMTDSVMQASGDTMTPMRLAVIFRVVHFALCPFLVFGLWIFPKLGIEGAAITNVLSQSLGTILGLWILMSGRSRLRFNFKGFRFDPPIIWRINRIGIPSSLMSLQIQLGQLILMRVVTNFGTLPLAAHTLSQRIDMLLFMPLMGLGVSAGVLVGQNLGAKKPQRAVKSSWVAVAYGQGAMLLCALCLILWAEYITGIFTSDPELITLSSHFMRIACINYAILSFNIVLSQCVNGAGDTLIPMTISIVTTWAIQVPLAIVLAQNAALGVFGVRWAMAVGAIVAALAYTIYFIMGRWKRKRL
jgi:putative MATE family efflux protein